MFSAEVLEEPFEEITELVLQGISTDCAIFLTKSERIQSKCRLVQEVSWLKRGKLMKWLFHLKSWI